MNILLLASAFNSLTQRVYVELSDRGHTVAVELSCEEAALRDALQRHRPALIVAPMLKEAIPEQVWSAHTCLIVHPGPLGDRGPSSLDWAVQEGVDQWGVTVLRANAEMDAGDVWASVSCPLPPLGKSDLYRNEVSDAALQAVLLAVERFASGTFVPRSQNSAVEGIAVTTRPYLRQETRRIDWAADSTGTVVRKLRSADSQPGVLDELLGAPWFLHGGHPEDTLTGAPGDVLATRAGAICRATRDGAVWIPQLRPRRLPGQLPTFSLPATTALGKWLPPVPDVPYPLDSAHDDRHTWTDIHYREHGETGFLGFSFPGGAMSTTHCERLLTAYRYACTRPTSVLVLGGGRDFFSNGIHLNVIEAAPDPAAESWANINAIDDVVQAILTTTDRYVISALGGNAAAGGAMLALAADKVWCRTGVVLNPHYRRMGLYGSEYWTYSLPRRVGAVVAEQLTERAMPVSAATGQRLGLVDRLFDSSPQDFAGRVAEFAVRLASTPSTRTRIAAKKAERDTAEAAKPLAAYREEELGRMRQIFNDPDQPYHALRRAFVHKA
ncbi:hydrogenase maturation protein [Streptomyces sp. H27-D2]|uniref:hydrogenase maturation protein n=1 Tax=Streptomyces sp. H27-D2 TaxID=3046304 RepID=UPI002DBE6D02|nr:hydrogenase maturation protein [Streptomyces sp. H27-D2]MEC4019898.1 hydrogenase maturation protein [Streptomyces sp. H27-D2]